MITTRELADRLGLRRAGRDWRGTCPLCGYRDALILSAGRTGARVVRRVPGPRRTARAATRTRCHLIGADGIR